jgi:hypothetical protein
MQQFTITKHDGEYEGLDEFLHALRPMRNGIYTVIVKRRQTRRTLAQNDLMWLWLTCMEQELKEDTGATKEDFYMYYCGKFLTKTIRMGDRLEKVVTTSSKLTKEQMTEFLNNIQADAATEWGITLPNPEDRLFEYFYNEYHE